MSLVLHCGARRAERDEVFGIPTPESTSTHHPISHQFFIESIEEAILDAEYAIQECAHALDNNGDKYFGLFGIEPQLNKNDTLNDDSAMILGARHSHNKSLSVGICVGRKVFVCDNLAFSGEIKFFRKHTKDVESDLQVKLESALEKLPMFADKHRDLMRIFKSREISNEKARDLIIEGGKRSVIPGSKLMNVVKEWEKPSYKEFEADGMSLYRLHNAFTTVLKNSNKNVFAIPERTMSLNDMLKESVMAA